MDLQSHVFLHSRLLKTSSYITRKYKICVTERVALHSQRMKCPSQVALNSLGYDRWGSEEEEGEEEEEEGGGGEGGGGGAAEVEEGEDRGGEEREGEERGG